MGQRPEFLWEKRMAGRDLAQYCYCCVLVLSRFVSAWQIFFHILFEAYYYYCILTDQSSIRRVKKIRKVNVMLVANMAC